MNNHVVIMAGGIGSRFWPMSTPECPKQFIDILGCGKTLIQLTVERFGNVCPQENMWVVTSEKYIDTIWSNCLVSRKVIYWQNPVPEIQLPALRMPAGK